MEQMRVYSWPRTLFLPCVKPLEVSVLYTLPHPSAVDSSLPSFLTLPPSLPLFHFSSPPSLPSLPPSLPLLPPSLPPPPPSSLSLPPLPPPSLLPPPSSLPLPPLPSFLTPSLPHSLTGKCYVVSNQKSLVQCMESLTQKLHPGVVVNFQKIGGSSPSNNDNSVPIPMEIDQPNDTVVASRWNREYSQEAEGLKGTPPPPKSTTAWQNTRKMIFVKSNPKSNVPSGFWPIPESFWPDTNTTTLVSRITVSPLASNH